MTYKKLTRNQYFQTSGPKRILALDGGGVRGIVALGYLQRVEDLLKQRHGGDDKFRLAHYFDLMAGTFNGVDHRRGPGARHVRGRADGPVHAPRQGGLSPKQLAERHPKWRGTATKSSASASN